RARHSRARGRTRRSPARPLRGRHGGGRPSRSASSTACSRAGCTARREGRGPRARPRRRRRVRSGPPHTPHCRPRSRPRRNDSKSAAPRGAAPRCAIYGPAEWFHAGDRRGARGTSGTVNLAAVRSSGRTAFFRPVPSAVGLPALVAVGLAGLTVGFFFWYAYALRGPHSPISLDLALPVALAGGLAVTYGGWLGYGRYVARRARVDESAALQYDAISWATLVVLWGTLLPPTGPAGTERAAAIAVALFVIAKVAVACRLSRTVREVTTTFIVTRLALIAIAELASMVIGQRPGVHYAASANPLLAVWGRWDAEHYLGIAQQGYSGFEPAFFPLYPLLIRIVTTLTGSHLIAGLIVSNTAGFFALLYLYKLVAHEYNRQVAQRAVFYVSIFPTAIFFSAVYSESLFLFLTVGSFYYVRERAWIKAGLFGFFAALTRSEGVLLAVPFLIEWLVAFREGGREFARYWFDDIVKPLVGMALVPLGLGVYMAYLWVLTGDPLRFSHVQTHWDRHAAAPWV